MDTSYKCTYMHIYRLMCSTNRMIARDSHEEIQIIDVVNETVQAPGLAQVHREHKTVPSTTCCNSILKAV
jgi:hypothetical protein